MDNINTPYAHEYWDQEAEAIREGAYKKAFSSLRNHEDAEDVAQDTLLKSWLVAQTIHTGKAIPFTKTIADRLAIDRIRYNRYRQHSQIEDGAKEMPSTVEEPSMAVEREETSRLVQEAIGTLPVRDRDLIRMYHYGEMSYGDIAKRRKRALGTVKSGISRARDRLRIVLVNTR